MDIAGLTSILPRRGTDCVKWDTCAPDELPLWVADMDFAPPACVAEAIRTRLEHPILGYTFASRAWEEAVRTWCRERQGWEPGRLMALQGVMSGLQGGILAGSRAGDRVVIQSPVYHPFNSVPTRLERQVVECPLRVDLAPDADEAGNRPVSMSFDWECLEREFARPDTTVMIFCSPHNPGGVIWDRETLVRLGTLARQHGVTLVVDEIHADIVRREGDFLSFGRLLAEKAWQDNPPAAVVIQAPTKTFNCAGISSAWAVTSTEALFKTMDGIIRGLGTEVLNILSYAAATALYRDGLPWLETVRAAINDNLAWLADQVAGYNRRARTAGKPLLAASTPRASYLFWLHVGAVVPGDVKSFVLALRDKGLRLNPGSQFGTGGEGFVRINAACHRSVLEEAWKRLEAALGA